MMTYIVNSEDICITVFAEIVYGCKNPHESEEPFKKKHMIPLMERTNSQIRSLSMRFCDSLIQGLGGPLCPNVLNTR